ncbi:hypothetical protein SAMN04487944_10832 [Gracilibacillus ureilyticus]|uniref:Lipoprotein n=1 Tax=Gracilibacillus ureilyticus TaxID=531814 RepID=A0A1H9R605_9BACI|nr:DUF6376 family protein [Gracilibacillus ureilyticus]SER67965.1 hypothetical protein SAMN04487944_10832 [Gracilibacillus ureilyticus]
MKRLSIIGITILFLTGCSFLEDVNSSLDYAEKATTYLTELSNFAEEGPQMIEGVMNDTVTEQELEEQLLTIQSMIEDFNKVEVPAVAEEIHQNIMMKNEELLNEINTVIEDGNLVIDQLENSEIVQTINEASELLNRIENLGL